MLFGRKNEINVGTLSFSGDVLTTKFEVPFDDGPEVNVANAEIYNLSDDTINKLKNDSIAFINAGYSESVGAIILGTVKNIRTTWNGTDKITSFDILDSGDNKADLKIKKSYNKNTYASTILNDLLAMTELKIAPYTLPINKVYVGGKSFDSTLREAIIEVVRDCGAIFTTNKNTIHIKSKNATIGTVVYVDYERGLIGSPTRIEKEEVESIDKDGNEITKTVSGWKIISLLNHKISTSSLIEVKSNTANGLFRVDNGVHTSDGDVYYTEMEVYPL